MALNRVIILERGTPTEVEASSAGLYSVRLCSKELGGLFIIRCK